MRKFYLTGFAGLLVAAAGCGPSTTINTTPLSDEQKRQVQAEDKQVADEESQGSVNKPKKGAKKAGPGGK